MTPSWSRWFAAPTPTAGRAAASTGPARSGTSCAAKASRSAATASSDSCAKKDCGAPAGGHSFITTRPDPAANRPPDLVNQQFLAERPNQLWIVDFTYVPTWSGVAFTAFVTDVYSRRIVGWRSATSMPTELPLEALEMALWVRDCAGQDITGLVHHSDAGSQYTSIRYSNRLDDAGAVASIGTVGDSFDNARAESVIGLYKTECVRPNGPFRGVEALELTTLSWVHWFNHDRLHAALSYKTPVEHENDYNLATNPTRQEPLPGQPALH